MSEARDAAIYPSMHMTDSHSKEMHCKMSAVPRLRNLRVRNQEMLVTVITGTNKHNSKLFDNTYHAPHSILMTLHILTKFNPYQNAATITICVSLSQTRGYCDKDSSFPHPGRHQNPQLHYSKSFWKTVLIGRYIIRRLYRFWMLYLLPQPTLTLQFTFQECWNSHICLFLIR